MVDPVVIVTSTAPSDLAYSWGTVSPGKIYKLNIKHQYNFGIRTAQKSVKLTKIYVVNH